MESKIGVLFCKCGAGIFSVIESEKLAKLLDELQADVYELQDLCALSIHEKEFLNEIGKSYNQKIIIACYPRAIENLFKQNKIDFGNFVVINFREKLASTILEKLKERYNIPDGSAHYQVKKSELTVPAWFPIIDESRCTLCGQCSHFCLFGVYHFNKKALSVVNPLACKNNCPACGRICPGSAIIFPRLAESSVLTGAIPGDVSITAKPADNGHLFALLNERNKRRTSIFRPDLVQKAEEERNKAIDELKNKEN